MGVKANVFPPLSVRPHVHIRCVCVCVGVCHGPSSLRMHPGKNLIRAEQTLTPAFFFSFFLLFHPGLRTRNRGHERQIEPIKRAEVEGLGRDVIAAQSPPSERNDALLLSQGRLFIVCWC